MKDWYYKVLIPTLNPPSPDDPFVGSVNILGTRYHYEDLYGHFYEAGPDGTGGELSGDRTLVIPIQRDDGTSEWAERFNVEYIEKLKHGMGIIRFNSQYKCDCEAMKGQIFKYDNCQVLPSNFKLNEKELRIFHGVDLAISEDEENDMFAQVVLGLNEANDVYVLDYQEERLRFAEQTRAIIDFRKKWKPIRTGVEANAYQKGQIHQLEDAGHKGIVAIYTLKDKVTRAWNLEAEIFHTNKVWFKPDQTHLREILVLFPNYRFKDLFDAFDIAYTTYKRRRRKVRDNEPGVI